MAAKTAALRCPVQAAQRRQLGDGGPGEMRDAIVSLGVGAGRKQSALRQKRTLTNVPKAVACNDRRHPYQTITPPNAFPATALESPICRPLPRSTPQAGRDLG